MMTRGHWIVAGVVLTLAVLFMPKGCASKVFKWVDEQGVTHYGDRAPENGQAEILEIKTPPPADTTRQVRITNRGTRRYPEMAIENPFFGPVHVVFKLTRAENIVTEPALPRGVLETVLPARYNEVMLYISPEDTQRPWSWGYEFRWEMGDPTAVHAPQKPYLVPFRIDGSALIGQAFNGDTTHNNPQNRFAVDIGLPMGTPVLAARGGVVMDVEDRFADGQAESEYVQRNNYVRIVHDDGTMAVYAHLKRGAIRVQPGQRVRRGQIIARSGNSGFSSGPHLHFAVQKNDAGLLTSIPFQFAGPDGEPLTPKKGQWLRSE